jgi:hypothetical protein
VKTPGGEVRNNNDSGQFNEFEIITKQETALEHKFRIINDRVSLVDIPGIDDGILATHITGYIEKKAEKLVPIILIHLTAGGF